MANARSTRTRTAKGTTCHSPTREPRLDPQVLARHQHGVMPHGWPPGRAPTRPAARVGTAVRVTRRPPGSSPLTRPPPMDTTRSARGTESSGSCDDNNTLAPSATASPISCPSSVREVASSPACGSSRSQRAGRRATQRGERDPAALAGGQPAGRRRAQTAGQAETLERRVGIAHGQSEGAHGELDVLRRAELVVERGGMPQKPDVAAHRRVVRGQIDAQDAWLRPRSRGAARRRHAAGWSCRHRWRRPPRPPRPGRETDRPRQGLGSGRRVRPRHESERQGPWRASPW